MKKLLLFLPFELRIFFVNRGWFLDIFINDKDPFIRGHVAYQNYGLEQLINDKDDIVRVHVARVGYGLNRLINDEYVSVRKTVIKYCEQSDKEEHKRILLLNNL